VRILAQVPVSAADLADPSARGRVALAIQEAVLTGLLGYLQQPGTQRTPADPSLAMPGFGKGRPARRKRRRSETQEPVPR
jgi:hypothetical protein